MLKNWCTWSTVNYMIKSRIHPPSDLIAGLYTKRLARGAVGPIPIRRSSVEIISSYLCSTALYPLFLPNSSPFHSHIFVSAQTSRSDTTGSSVVHVAAAKCALMNTWSRAAWAWFIVVSYKHKSRISDQTTTVYCSHLDVLHERTRQNADKKRPNTTKNGENDWLLTGQAT